ncbi:unnamed protein product, partial [Allacma fusca]
MSSMEAELDRAQAIIDAVRGPRSDGVYINFPPPPPPLPAFT